MADSAQSGHGSGAVQIVVATAIGGGCGYVLTILAGKSLGSVDYGTFAVFWSALYLIISAVSGIQQEVTRASRPRVEGGAGPSTIRNYAVCVALAIAAATIATSPLWVGAVFPTEGEALVWPLAFGLAWYVIVAVIGGILYGLQIWRFIGVMIAMDGILRLLITGTLLLVSANLTAIAWGVVAPFALAPIITWFFVRRRIVGKFSLDVADFRRLTWNISRTVVGAAATGVLVSGFPLLLEATSRHDSRSALAALIFAINLTRAPIVIVVLSLQSFLVVYYRSLGERYRRRLLAIIGAVLALTVLVAAAVAVVGPWVLETFFGHAYALGPWVLAALVASGGAVGLLCATGPAVLARGHHALYTSGWATAAVATIVILALPIPLTSRTILALWIGPLAGLSIHLVATLAAPRVPSPAR